MFGYLRFVLAFFVLLSHVDVRFHGLNPGVIAVVIFYLLAGHVVSHLWQDIISPGSGKLYRFYKDRVLRILPLYSYVALLTLVFLIITGYGNPKFSLMKLVGNFLIVPLNYYMVIDSTILVNPDWCLIPPAWSLGAELQAYLILPLALMVKELKIILIIASFAIYMLANLSVINPDYFGYRLIFGVFFVFVAGSSLQVARTVGTGSKFDTIYPWLLWSFVACLSVVFSCYGLFSPAYTRETFMGLLMGIPLIYILDKKKLKLPGNALLGSLSYGVFLSHFFWIWYLDHSGLIERQNMTYIPVIAAGSVLVAYTGIRFLERPIDKIRK